MCLLQVLLGLGVVDEKYKKMSGKSPLWLEKEPYTVKWLADSEFKPEWVEGKKP